MKATLDKNNSQRILNENNIILLVNSQINHEERIVQKAFTPLTGGSNFFSGVPTS